MPHAYNEPHKSQRNGVTLR